jgi:seryl-tRNA synthetase
MNKNNIKQLSPDDEEIEREFQNGINGIKTLFNKQAESFIAQLAIINSRQQMLDNEVVILTKRVGKIENEFKEMKQLVEKFKKDLQFITENSVPINLIPFLHELFFLGNLRGHNN